jgi:hypothetical protein
MPLIEGKSQKSFKKNIEAEMDAGKAQRQSVAIAYAMKRKAEERDRNKAHGGMMHYAHGGYAEGDMDEECYDCMRGNCDVHDPEGMNMLHEGGGDIVDRIIRRRMSEGGRVANQEHGPDDDDLAGFSPAEYDDLVLDDYLEPHYPAENRDLIGNEKEDEEDRDIVSRIMKSRRLRDKMPIAGYGESYGRNK